MIFVKVLCQNATEAIGSVYSVEFFINYKGLLHGFCLTHFFYFRIHSPKSVTPSTNMNN